MSNELEVSTATLADRANSEHAAAIASLLDAQRHAIEAGRALAAAKAATGHIDFGHWLAMHFRGSPRTVLQFMRIAEQVMDYDK